MKNLSQLKLSKKQVRTKIIEALLFISAGLSFISIFFISFFIFKEGIPLLKEVSLIDFLFGTVWAPTGNNPQFGLFPIIAGSVCVTALSVLMAAPIGIASAVYLSEIAPPKISSIMLQMTQLLAGIPSVIFGLFGYTAIAPLIRRFSGNPTGLGILTASLVLAIMILPTIINVTFVSLSSVSKELRQGSFSLGATRFQTIVRIILPKCRSAISAGILLGMGRALGETMAVLMVAGNAPLFPTSLNSYTRTLTMNIAGDMSYASGLHYTSLFTTGMVLFVFIFILNRVSSALIMQGEKE